jgi:hypothetical protein
MKNVFLRLKNVSDKSVEIIRRKYHVQQNFSKNLAVYQIMWKNIVEPDRSHNNIIWRKQALCVLDIKGNATYTHS